MKSLQELTNQELADYRSDLIEKQKATATKRATVTGARKTKLTRDLEDTERRLMLVNKEVERRADLAIQRGELRDSKNPDWDTRPIPPVDVDTCDIWRSFVAEGAGASKPVLNGVVGEQQLSATLEIHPGSLSVPAILAVAAQINQLNKTLTRLTDLVEPVLGQVKDPAAFLSQVKDPTTLATTVADYTRALELVRKNLEENDKKHKEAEVRKRLGGD